MIIAIKDNDLYIDYAERFSDEVIVAEPYNYQLVVLPDGITDVEYTDFCKVDGVFVFDIASRTERLQSVQKQTYSVLIEQGIRKQYSINDEIAILRQRDTKPQEFADYNAYVEVIKQQARQ